MRARFRLPQRQPNLSDQLLIAKTARRSLAVPVDVVTGVAECPESEFTSAEKISPGLEYLKGVVKLENGIVFIHDLDTFLSLDEERGLDETLTERTRTSS